MITPELAELISAAIESELIDVHTAIPAQIVVYDPATKTATIQLDNKRILEKDDGTLKTEIMTPIQNVPIAIPGSLTCFMAFFLQPGTPGHLLCSESSIDQWRTKGTLTSPADTERHGLTGFFHPDWRPITALITDVLVQGAVFGNIAGYQVRANPTAIEITSGGLPASVGGYVAMATKVNALWIALQAALNTWGGSPHTPDGGQALAASLASMLAALPTFGMVDSTNLKAD